MIDRGVFVRSAQWFFRVLGVCGVSLWTSGIAPTFNVLGELLVIIAVLAFVFTYVRTHRAVAGDLMATVPNGESSSFEACHIEPAESRWQFVLVGLALLAGFIIASFAVFGSLLKLWLI